MGKPSSAGEKAVAAYDEDAVTMAIAAAFGLEKRSEKKVDALHFATTSAPYGEKQSTALIASAFDLQKECWTFDFTNSVRARTLAMKAALDAVKSGSAENGMVVASDCKCGAAQSTFEQTLGDGAAAILARADMAKKFRDDLIYLKAANIATGTWEGSMRQD